MQFCRIRLLLVSALALIGTLPAPLRAQTSPVTINDPKPDCDAGKDGTSGCRAAEHGHDASQNARTKPKKNSAGKAGEDDDGPFMNTGLKIWVTKGGSYCIREINVDGKLSCQSEAVWAKEGVTFKRTISDLP